MKAGILLLGLLVLALHAPVVRAQTTPFPNYRVVLNDTAKATHYLAFFNYNSDFHKWVTQQPAAAVSAQTGLTATQVSGVDQLCSQVAAQLQQLATDRAAELAKSPAQSDSVQRKYDFLRVRFSLEGALKVAQSLDEGSWNKLRGYIVGPFQAQPKTTPVTWP